MGIDTQVHGDPAALTALGTMVEEMAQALTDAATDLSGLREQADGAWDGYASLQVFGTFDRTRGELEEISGPVAALAGAITALGTALEGVANDMGGLLTTAVLADLVTTPTSIEFPAAAVPGVTPEEQQEQADRVESWYQLQERADGYRQTETVAHEALVDAVGEFLAVPVVVDILQRVGFMPSGDSPHDIGSWLGGLGLSGVGWASDWWTKLKTGTYRPRSPNGQFRTSLGTGSWREAVASTRSDNWGARANQAVTNTRWQTAGKWAGRVGTAVSFGTAAWGQWQEDADDPAMGWEERGARAATVGAATAAGGWAGAAAGGKALGAIGFMVGGPLGAAVGGIAGGIIGGAIGAGVGEWAGDLAKKGVGKFVDAISFWN